MKRVERNTRVAVYRLASVLISTLFVALALIVFCSKAVAQMESPGFLFPWSDKDDAIRWHSTAKLVGTGPTGLHSQESKVTNVKKA